ncbi:MAG: glutamine-hydrolyzing carbamoyl-phosphate synthase small subunit [Deinococcus sp.]|nr:glutamine-hydrolyzing carbamoyl-phosphate synthase small subunit [Deinococcus sp.]
MSGVERPAILALEDGTIYQGGAFGAQGSVAGEVVFNTSMTGYQEILTDPSYHGQLVTMTYPHIGNYGVTQEDMESRAPYVKGFIVREFCRQPSNYRAQKTLEQFLIDYGVVGIEGIDTRALVRKIREGGVVKGVIASGNHNPQELVEQARAHLDIDGRDITPEVTTPAPYKLDNVKSAPRIVVMDFGIKTTMLQKMRAAGAEVLVVPAHTTAGEILALNPAGVMLSNGPGDPGAATYAIATVRQLVGQVPLYGICLGHQLLGLAVGAKYFKLKFGHRGANQPVKNLITGRIEITAQNHGYAVDLDSLEKLGFLPTHVNLNDGTLEGMAHRYHPIFSVQYHPEASPGPHDAGYLFQQFMRTVQEHPNGEPVRPVAVGGR